ncbi:hypothetical protein L7F22_049013 [Adiantum nelumboides]|nr:hypothetical protein [Adiantum nelumboides]
MATSSEAAMQQMMQQIAVYTQQQQTLQQQYQLQGLSARELLREFEKKYEQLSSTEQRSIRSERVELFVQAADTRLQKSLMQLLENARGDLGLTSKWKLVPEVVNMIVKRQMRVDTLIVVD